jgi:hypothetical protein
MNLKRRAILIAVAGAIAGTTAFPVGGLYAAVLTGGWVVSLLTALAGVPVLAKRAWAKGVSDPSDPARIAFAGAVKADVLPQVDDLIRKRLGDLDAQWQRLEGSLASIRLELGPIKALGRRVKLEDGREELAIELTLATVVNSLNAMSAWLTAEDGLPAVVENAAKAASMSATASEMGKLGREAQVAAAEAQGTKAAEMVIWAQEHPQEAAMGMQLKEEEAAIDEALGMVGLKGGSAFAALAKKAAKRRLIQGSLPASNPSGQGGFRPM